MRGIVKGGEKPQILQ
jgi:hypothetical protein